MLHKDPFLIKPETFDLIQRLQSLDFLVDFYLVGGTALALQIGHRNSIDIDLFSRETFNSNQFIGQLQAKFTLEVTFEATNTLLTFIEHIKVDFITHNYPLINPPKEEEGIRFLSLPDIAAMKLNAISNSGKRLKDFIDIYFLLEHFSMSEMIEFYTIKYPNFNPLIALRAVSYFDDIDPSVDPPKLPVKLSLEKIKKRISQSVLHSKRRFDF
ncbi:MAG: nucleotidyl transferase AbiEii/AbiGii toxin family protein [Cyclobacteriaceae bacterium]|nr:nucleotidyl transferase AbiEii/AbiGii toxin family protein [Cyclobacteriaceae bacterium]UYN85656.1 MAG: nucleotidyl transferase AbiEii/AbiGii toxin family protein [Cyclobacteriaceae bacterium]